MKENKGDDSNQLSKFGKLTYDNKLKVVTGSMSEGLSTRFKSDSLECIPQSHLDKYKELLIDDVVDDPKRINFTLFEGDLIGPVVYRYTELWTYCCSYSSVADAAKETGIDHDDIYRACSDNTETARGFRWSFKAPEEVEALGYGVCLASIDSSALIGNVGLIDIPPVYNPAGSDKFISDLLQAKLKADVE